MTICIAALYDNGNGAVLVSDQMVTAHVPIGYEYEHRDTAKIIPVDEARETYALLAGDVLSGNEIIAHAKRQLLQKDGGSPASEIAELLRIAYQQVRLTAIIAKELEPRGMNLDTFYARHQQLAPHVVQVVDQAMSQTDIGVQMLVAGSNGASHTIHTILNPGAIVDNTAIGHGAIGSGAPHSLLSLIEDEYSPSLDRETVLKMVKRAKSRSEVAPGVGTRTHTLIIPEENDDDAHPEEAG